MEVLIFLKCCVNVNCVLKYVGVVKSLPECIEMWEMSVEVQFFFSGLVAPQETAWSWTDT